VCVLSKADKLPQAEEKMILDKIIKTKNDEVAQLKKHTTEAALKKSIAELPACRNFEKAVSGKDCSIIAEVKCSSPSRGRLIADFDPLRIATIYEQNGAAAISVLTDEKYFCGHKDYLSKIKKQVKLPVLRKDFIVDPLQIYETRAIGADAILLIVHILGKKLAEFIALAKELGLHPLTEVHKQTELEVALAANADIVGVNNRNLDTFVTDIRTSGALKSLIPTDKIVVAESGIASRADIESLMKVGIYSFLIGEALITAPDIGEKLRELKG
jgi:indole-3-glycerol phosphate synthase